MPSPHFLADTLHLTHGRAIAFATGVKLTRPDLDVIVISGDGDLTTIGGNHLTHAARRNLPVRIFCLNRWLFGMTGGQVSATTPQGTMTATTPVGNPDRGFDLVRLMRGAGAPYVARRPVAKTVQMQRGIENALQEPGFAFVEVLSTCPTQCGHANRQSLDEDAVSLMGTIVTELLLIMLLTLANGLLSMSEIAIVSARKVRLRQYVAGGDPRGQIALQLAAEPSRFLSTVQAGITLVGILAGALGGATLAKELGAVFHRIPFLAAWSEALGLAVVVLCITYLSLVIGELVAKRLALNNAEKIALAVAGPMDRLSVLSSPIVRFLSLSTDSVLRLLGSRLSSEPPVSEQEVAFMIDEGTQAGVFEQIERDIVRCVFRLGDQRVSNLMTHRTEIVWLDLDDPPHEIVDH